MRGSIGLVIGVALGAGAMYLVLRPPWAPRTHPAPADSPPVVMVPGDAGVPHPKKRRRPHAPSTAGQSASPASATADGDADDSPAPPPLTAADRAPESRGDDVSPPPRNLDLGAGGAEPRSLDDVEITRTINSQAGGVRDCVVQAATNTDLRATITVKLLVDGRGRVSRSRIEAPHYLFEHGLLTCTQRAVGRMHFPATGGTTVVTLPVNLGG